jgi:hypothetical protein
MPVLRKSFILILCLTIMVMFVNLASADPDVKLEEKENPKHCTKDDPRPECSGVNAKTTPEVKATAVSAEGEKAEAEECTHGLKTNCIETFHSAMAPCCHELIPQGKIAEARAAIPQMTAASKEIAEYSPGCTYGKSLLEAYEAKRTVFLTSMAELEKATENPDDEAFKAAFDKMHSAFEQMNGVLYMRPEGIQEFHNVLLSIWHDYLPAEKYDEIKGAMPELLKTAENLTKIKLDEQLIDKQEAFTNNAQKIYKCAQDLEKACEEDNGEKIAETTKALHESYVNLTSNM